MPHANSTKMIITPLEQERGSKTTFGAIVTGVDLNNLDEESFQTLRNAVYTHSVIVIKGQHDLVPAKQFDLVHRFDPDANPSHGFGYGKSTDELGSLGKKPFYVIPESGGVTLVGHGYQGKDHYGLKDITLDAISHVDFHANPLTKEQLANGKARFNSFHFDGIIYGSHPSRVTTFRCVKAPKGPDVTVRFDNETEHIIKCRPGSTAFISSKQIYESLTNEEKKIADSSFWEPAPHPFAWTGTRGLRSNGLGVAPGGKTVPVDQLPAWTPDKVYKYPLVWLNPVTGEKGFQVFPETVRKLYLNDSEDGQLRVVEDEEEIRCWLNRIFDRICIPDYVLVPPCEEGDIAIWNNWGVLHSAIEYPISYGPRSMHQCHIASTTAPVGPVNVSILG